MAILRIWIAVFLLYGMSFAQIKVRPGEVSVLEVEIPKVFVAGEEYSLKVRAVDRFGNPSNNFGSAAAISIKSAGLPVLTPVVSPKDIIDGVFYIKVQPSKTGEYTVSASLNEKTLPFRLKPSDETVSQLRIKVVNGKVENIAISAPDMFTPGYSYTARLFFYDKEGNPVVEKDHINQTITITAERFSREIKVKELESYQYDLNIVPYSTANFEISVIDNITQKKLASKIVRPEIQTVGRFEIEVPSEIEAGSPFRIRIKALDSSGRLIKVFDKIGKDIKLHTTGTGQLIPDTVPRELFRDGVAEIELIYTKSEVINIYASLSDGKEAITMTVPAATRLEETKKVAREEKPAPQPPEQKRTVEEPKKEEPKAEEVKKPAETKKEQPKPQKPEKTSIKLRFPTEIGQLARITELSRDKTSLLIKGFFENRNPDYEIKKFENDISINNQKVGKISFYEDKDTNLIISVKMNEEGYQIQYNLSPKNLLEIKIERIR